MFSIKVLPWKQAANPKAKTDIRHGEIRIGDDVETFELSISYWTLDDYVKHWESALQRILDGHEKSALITFMLDPKTANFIRWRPMYRQDTRVIFQDQILFIDQIGGAFNLQNPFVHVRERNTSSDGDAHPVSEWVTDVTALEAFLRASK